jgi:fructuronate reductase
MTPLSHATLAQLPAGVTRPDYDTARTATGIVHLGLGNFHRAHQAVYTDRVLARDPSWGICGVSLRSAGVTAELARQDHLYSVTSRGPEGNTTRVIGSVRQALAGATQQAAVLGAIAAPATRIASLTITEKGYCHDTASGRLNRAHPDIAHDLAHPAAPRSAPGVLLQGLRQRMAHGAPLTVLSCDNLPHNGATTRAILIEMADLTDERLAKWIGDTLAFPSSMVDRIVPATTPADLEAVRALGIDDAAAVATEPFTQWVIEDTFAAGRPAWEAAGAQFVSDVAPFEMMKLRLLNGAHSAMAYLGYLAGHDYIWQASSEAAFQGLVERLWAELEPTLPPSLARTPGVDLAAYKRELMQRFRNSALPHRTWQIAMDGSQKLPQRLFAAALERIGRGESIDTIALTIAAWMRYAAGRDENGNAIDVRDPLAAEFARVAAAAGTDIDALGRGLLGIEVMFGTALPLEPKFVEPVLAHLRQLFARGARAVLPPA